MFFTSAVVRFHCDEAFCYRDPEQNCDLGLIPM